MRSTITQLVPIAAVRQITLTSKIQRYFVNFLDSKNKLLFLMFQDQQDLLRMTLEKLRSSRAPTVQMIVVSYYLCLVISVEVANVTVTIKN